MDLIQSFYGARFALLADDIISFRNRSNVLGLHFSNAENSPKKLPQNDLFRSKSLKHTFFCVFSPRKKRESAFPWSYMEPYDFIICDCISQCSEMKVQSWLNFVRCFR